MNTQIPELNQPFEVSFRNYHDYKFKAKVVSVDKSGPYGIRVNIFEKTQRFINHVEQKNMNEFCDVEIAWFNTELTGRIIKPILL